MANGSCLQGARRTLSELGPDLLIEISPLDLIEIGNDSRKLAQQIEDFDYAIYALRGNGTPGERLSASTLNPSFSAQNVLCAPNPKFNGWAASPCQRSQPSARISSAPAKKPAEVKPKYSNEYFANPYVLTALQPQSADGGAGKARAALSRP